MIRRRTPNRRLNRIFLALGFVPALVILVGGVAELAMIGKHYEQSSAPPVVAAPQVDHDGKVDSKKLSKKERAFIVAVESAYGENLPALRERNAITMGHTYCAVVGAGFTKGQITRLYGKSKNRPEAKGVDLLSLSTKTLCPRKK